MKRCVGMILLLVAFIAQAQRQGADLAGIDWQVQHVKKSMPDTLAFQLTSPYSTELEKVRAIYSWICQNIGYNVNIFRPISLRPRFVPEPIDTISEWKTADEMVARKVLRRGVAVCEGYAKLFKVLCDYAGLQAVVLNGYVRTDFDRTADRFRTNHTWNAVRIDSAWHLVDATWGAGYVSYGEEFIQKQNDFYFLTAPEIFIRDHYPEDLRWALLPQPPSLSEFRNMPFKPKSFIKYGIHAYTPANGLVEAEAGDTLSFSISLKDVKRAKNTSADPFLDTAVFALSPLSVFIKPEKEEGHQVYYQYIADASTQWVHLLYNGDIILRYSLSRKRTLAGN